MATNNVATPASVQTCMVNRVRPIRDLMGGTEKMRKARDTYLPKEEGESETNYDARLKRTFLFNALAKSVEDMTGKVFMKPVLLAKDVDPEISAWSENIDNAGRHLNVFAKDAFFDSVQAGIGFILADAPPPPVREDNQPPTVADYQSTKWRPYLTFIPLENLIGWKTEIIDGVVILTQIRIKECATEPEGEYGEKEIPQIRVITLIGAACTWETFRKAENSDDWVPHASGKITSKRIPISPIYINRTDFMQAAPPLEKLAELNIAHWQSSSDQRNIVHVARVPILFGAGFDEQAKLTIGAGSMIRTSNPAAKLEYVEHSGQAIKAGADDLKSLEDQMQNMGLQLATQAPGGQTATGEVRDDAKENSALCMGATALQDAIEMAFSFMAELADKPALAGGSVTVNKEFGISSSRVDWQFLTQAYIAGKLDTETYINEGKRRGVFAEDVDPDTIKDRIQAEMPELPAAGMDLGSGNANGQ